MHRPPTAPARRRVALLLLALSLLVVASSSSGNDNDPNQNKEEKQPWTGDGLFLPAQLTEREVFVDGLGGVRASDEDSSNEEQDRPHTVDEAGEIGRLFFGLLRRARAQERATPNVGGSANAFTRALGTRTAQRRNATVVLSSGPLNAAALGTSGAAAVTPGGSGDLARADARAGSSAYASAILDDENKKPKDFWAAGSARGSTVAESSDGGSGITGPARAAGAQTVLGTAASAGEQAATGRAGLGIGPFLVLFTLGQRDGAQQSGGAGSVGIGERASTRLQVASLAEGDKSDEKADLDRMPRPSPPTKKEKEDKEDKEEQEQDLRTASSSSSSAQPSSPSPSPSPSKPPTAYDKLTARKRDRMSERKKRRTEKQEAKPKWEDSGIVTGRVVACDEQQGQDGDEEHGGDGSAGNAGRLHCRNDQDENNDHEYRGASALRAWADSADIPKLSTTGANIADTNVRAGLTSEAAANRYGYSRGVSTGSASATGTRAARARVTSASAGTGFVVKSTSATARVVERAEGGGGKDEKGKEKGGGGKDGGGGMD